MMRMRGLKCMPMCSATHALGPQSCRNRVQLGVKAEACRNRVAIVSQVPHLRRGSVCTAWGDPHQTIADKEQRACMPISLALVCLLLEREEGSVA